MHLSLFLFGIENVSHKMLFRLLGKDSWTRGNRIKVSSEKNKNKNNNVIMKGTVGPTFLSSDMLSRLNNRVLSRENRRLLSCRLRCEDSLATTFAANAAPDAAMGIPRCFCSCCTLLVLVQIIL